MKQKLCWGVQIILSSNLAEHDWGWSDQMTSKHQYLFSREQVQKNIKSCSVQ